MSFIRFAPVCILLALPVIAATVSTSASSTEFLQRRGARLYMGDTEIHLRGTNLGNWLLQEDFLFGLYGTHTQMRSTMAAVFGKPKADAFWNEYEYVFYTDKDAAFLQRVR